MGKKTRQFIGAIAFTATVGSGAAFADTTVELSTASASTGVSQTLSSVSEYSSSVTSESSYSSSSVQVQNEIDSTGSSTTPPETSENSQPLSNGIPNENFVPSTSDENQQPSVAGMGSATAVNPPQRLGAIGYLPLIWASANLYAYQAENPTQLMVVSPSTSSPAPVQSDPLGGFMDELSFLSQSIIPVSFGMLWAGLTSINLLALAALVFSILVIAMLTTSRHSASRYTEFLRSSGFTNAPRSDASWATSFATPLKWVLSAPMRV